MDKPFEEVFQEAVASTGSRYRQVRDVLVAEAANDDALQGKRRDEDWHVRLVAEIVVGRKKNPERYRFIRQVAEGTEPSLEGEKYLTGRPPIDVSVAALVPLGTPFLPALLEILYKERDEISDYAFWVCSNTILEWDDKRAIPVYREFLHDQAADPALRERSLQVLSSLGADGIFDDLLQVIEDEQDLDELRATAATMLGRADRVRAFPVLVDLLQDVETPASVQGGAVTGLGHTRNPDAADILLNEYRRHETVALKRRVIVALGDLGTDSARNALTQLQAAETDLALLQLIDSKVEQVERRP